MKLVLALVVAMSTWAMLMFAATSRELTKLEAAAAPPAFPKPETMPGFDLGDSNGDDYSKFIGDLREKLEDPKRVYFGVAMIQQFPRLQYMYVELKSAQENSITLAIRMSDLYVEGYSYKYRGQQLRARFLKLESTTVQQQVEKNLFTDAVNTDDKNIGYEGSYDKLEAKAELNIMNLKLGSERLETYINEITYKDYNKRPEFIRTEARLLLIVIQMVSEAIRFKYIEGKIKDNFYQGFAPDYTTIDLEKNWEKLSKAITKANPTTGAIPQNELNNLKIRDAQGKLRTIRNVFDIIGDMGLLKYLAPSSPKWLMMQQVDNVTVWEE